MNVVDNVSTMTLTSGRRLAWLEWGDPNGPAVFLVHGTPGSRLQLADLARGEGAAPARFVCVDRPGYGQSEFDPDATVVSAADDVRQLADHLGVDTFFLAGVSGGAPLVLAAAATLGARVTASAVIAAAVSPAPTDDTDDRQATADVTAPPNPEVLDDADDADDADDGSMLTPVSQPKMRQRLSAQMQVTISQRWPSLAVRMLRKRLAPVDADRLDRPDVVTRFVTDAAAPSRTTARTILQDVEVCAEVWLLPLEQVTSPLHVWHGTEDRTVPVERGRELVAAIPHAVEHEIDGEGHLLIVDHFEEVVEALFAP
jgi:pimeloyl-ACP methyl ester carboxylesterase